MAVSTHSFISFHDAMNPVKLEEMARKELGETEELKETCLQELRSLINDHKVTCISTDDFLIRFLRTKKFHTQKAFEALRNYSYQRSCFNQDLLELQPGILREITPIFGFLPYRDHEGRRIYYVRLGNWNPNVISMKDLLILYTLMGHCAAEEETTQIAGVTLLYDMRSAPVTFFVYFLRYINRWKNISFNCLPVRYTSIHVISDSTVLKYLHQMLFPFIPKKLAERIVFHEEPGETLFKHIPASILPDVFGGTLGPLDTDCMTKTLMDYLPKIKDEYYNFQQV